MTQMTPAESIFFAALERPPGERAAFVDAACGQDADLRARIGQMLAAQPDMAGFLDAPPDRPVAPPPPGPLPWSGAVIAGKYKLLQEVGEGGMGSVWMADQLEPVRRRVAVKLIRTDHGRSADILARFEAERQAIALMDHPHIAKLLDAGTTSAAEGTTVGAGRPYFVMELVKGVPLNAYCDEHQLSVPERLRLFLQICSAVQHAHQKGVIHRDLKPSNILVESHDGRPVPRVIDFGLAKAAGGMRLTENTLFTRLGTVAGTPQYMAPEQATFNALDVDTRADVYALGVILYELLTGTTPLSREAVKKAQIDEMLRLIREQDAPAPSSRLSSGAAAPGVAANRQTEPARLGRLVKGDLDWIVLKSLAKERDRRYDSAAGFATDVERFLNHEPVLAGPPGAAYRVRKFVRRNRPQVVAGGLLLLALLAGTAGTTFGLVRAEHRRRDATDVRAAEAEQRRRAEQARDRTREALDAMTSAAAGESLAAQPALSGEQETFLGGVLAYYQEFAGEQTGDEESRARSAAAALRVGQIEYRLGRPTAAADSFRRAAAAYDRLAADFPAAPPHRRQHGRARLDLGFALYHLGQRPEAEEQYRQGLAVLERLAAESPEEPADREVRAALHQNLGVLLNDLGRRPAATDEHHKSLALREKLAADFPDVPAYRRGLAMTHTNLAVLLAGHERSTDAAAQFRAARDITEKLAADHPAVRDYRQDLGAAYNNLGTLLNDPEPLRKAVDVREGLVADFPGVPAYRHDLAVSCYNFGNALLKDKQPAKAEEQLRKALALLVPLAASKSAVPAHPHALASAHNSLGDVLRSVPGKRAEAEEHFRKALALREKLAAGPAAEPDHRANLADSHSHLAVVLKDAGVLAEAEEQHRKALAVREKLVADFPGVPGYRINLGLGYSNLAGLLRDGDRPEQSLDWYDKAVTALAAAAEGAPVARPSLGRVLRAAGGRPGPAAAVRRSRRRLGPGVRVQPARRCAIRLNRAPALLSAGRAAEAMADVAELTKSSAWTAGQWYDFAVLCAGASARSADRRAENADRAMELLRKAVTAGFKDADRMAKDEALDALRGRDDFKKLLAEFATKKP